MTGAGWLDAKDVLWIERRDGHVLLKLAWNHRVVAVSRLDPDLWGYGYFYET